MLHHNPDGAIRQTPFAIITSPEADPDGGLGQNGVQQRFKAAQAVLSEDLGVAAE
jgi:hypothetical protein